MPKDKTDKGFRSVLDIDNTVNVMCDVLRQLGCLESNQLQPFSIPMLIDIDIPYMENETDVPYIRAFLKQLRIVQTLYFVRFTTSLLWAMNSDNGDVFYTRDETDKHKDVTWIVRYLGENDVEVTALAHFNQQFVLARDVSYQVNQPIAALGSEDDPDRVYEMMAAFHYKHCLNELKHHLDNDFHIVFIPNYDHSEFLPIPLYGMTKHDAKRKFLSLERTFDFLGKKHFDVMDTCPSEELIISYLIDEIRENENVCVDDRDICLTYGLAELLFGYHVYNRERRGETISSNELISFKDFNAQIIEIYTMRMGSSQV